MSHHRHDRVKRNGYGPVQDGLKGTTACDKTFEIKVKYQRRFAIAFDFWRYLPYRFAFVKRWIVVSHKWRMVKAVFRHGFFNRAPVAAKTIFKVVAGLWYPAWHLNDVKKPTQIFFLSLLRVAEPWKILGNVKVMLNACQVWQNVATHLPSPNLCAKASTSIL